MIAAFSVAPGGLGESVSEWVSDAVQLVRESGLPNETNAMFTNVEGEWDEVMALVKACVMRIAEHAPRVDLVMKVDYRPGVTGALRAKVEAIEERLESFAPRAEPRERVILNLPHEGIKYLPLVARTVAPGGRLYYYEVAARDELENRSEVVVGALGPQEHWRVVDRHVVHPYSPTSDLTAWVVERSER